MTSFLAVVDAWARETPDRLRDVLRSAAQDVAENVSVGGAFSPGSPVDTGFLRSQWTATLGEDVGTVVSAPAGLVTGQLAAEGQAAANEMNLVCASADLADVITLQNGTEYIAFLESGATPPEAPAISGWITMAAAAWPQIVAQANARVRGAA